VSKTWARRVTGSSKTFEGRTAANDLGFQVQFLLERKRIHYERRTVMVCLSDVVVCMFLWFIELLYVLPISNGNTCPLMVQIYGSFCGPRPVPCGSIFGMFWDHKGGHSLVPFTRPTWFMHDITLWSPKDVPELIPRFIVLTSKWVQLWTLCGPLWFSEWGPIKRKKQHIVWQQSVVW
jgi:hypothetical protein